MICDGCSTCCEEYPIDLTHEEWKYLKILKPDLTTIDFGKLHIIKPPCPFLVDHLCRIYKARPAVCRIYPLVVRTSKRGLKFGQHGGCKGDFVKGDFYHLVKTYIDFARYLKKNQHLIVTGKEKYKHDKWIQKNSKVGKSKFYPGILDSIMIANLMGKT